MRAKTAPKNSQDLQTGQNWIELKAFEKKGVVANDICTIVKKPYSSHQKKKVLEDISVIGQTLFNIDYRD